MFRLLSLLITMLSPRITIRKHFPSIHAGFRYPPFCIWLWRSEKRPKGRL